METPEFLALEEARWFALPYERALDRLQTSLEGLSHEEAKLRLTLCGPNHIAVKADGVLWTILRQFHNPLIYLLVASTALALLLGKMTDGIVILSVVLLITLISFIQEYRSSRSIYSLLQMIPQKSTLVRGGAHASFPSSEMVPGDIILLQPGDRVSADIRLIVTKNLECDESALTGESLPVVKRSEFVSEDAPLADRKCMAYSGTLVTTGRATGVVVATGLHTEFGKISKFLEQVSTPPTPLTQTLAHIVKWITGAVCLIGSAVFGVGYLRGYRLLDAGLASISLSVAAIPEGLPTAITVAAAIGVQRMARKRAIIRHLAAVETLGSTTVICSDKTGTLTQNEMTVQSLYTLQGSFFVSGVGYSPEGQISSQEGSSTDRADVSELLTAAVLCNDATIKQRESRWIPFGDPTELALIIAGRKEGLYENVIREEWPRIDVIPFEPERRIMATLHVSPSNKKTIFVKGAPEQVMKMCRPEDCRAVYAKVEAMAKQGMRVLALSKKVLPLDRHSLEEEDIRSDFTLLGLLGIADPPRQEVLEAIKSCQEAGITVKMITGDHPLTAGVIARELGLLGEGKVILCSDLDAMDSDELKSVIQHNHVFARALPEHKLKIVNVLQADGQVVAMTGDGVNDAPALKQANIGVAMGISGTAVAKEASDMVLADDNFASIESAVEEGRRVYDNLIKSIAFMFPTNLAQALVILIAVLFFPIEDSVLLLPILPVQILWINLIVCVALALPLAFEGMEPDIMQRPPRKPNAPLLSRFVLLRTLFVAALMTTGTIALFFWEYFSELAKGTSEKIAISEAQTLAVTTLMFFQVFYLFNCRSLRYSLFKIGLYSNPFVLVGILFVLLTQVAFVYVPLMNTFFGSSPLNIEAWLTAIAVGLLIAPLIALEKRLSSIGR